MCWHVVDGEVADKAKHVFEEDASKSVAATCKEEGQKVEVCTICGFEKVTKINKLEHKFDNGVVTKEATCAEPGVRTFTCELCGETKTEEMEEKTTSNDPVNKKERVGTYSL